MKIISLVIFSFFSLNALALQLTSVCKDLEDPVYAVSIPSRPKKIFIVEQVGRIVMCDEVTGTLTEFLNIKKRVSAGGEMGLLGLAFHPDFEKNKRYFVYYSAFRPDRANLVVEFTEGSDVEKVVLSVPQPYSNHNGGQIVFDSKGYLYIGKGDGGAGYDPKGNGQNLQSLLGKILRIDINKADPVRKTAYSIPSDNPFAHGGGLPEIYAYGIRNPWRFSFDSVTQTLWLGDVGQNMWEEIDIVEKGKNYGWKEREGKHCSPQIENCKKVGMVDPVFEYDHDQGVSITGGFVYRGNKIPELAGAYLYGDYQSGRIWALNWDVKTKTAISNRELLQQDLRISSFGLDSDGELLVVSHKGLVYRLVP